MRLRRSFVICFLFFCCTPEKPEKLEPLQLGGLLASAPDAPDVPEIQCVCEQSGAGQVDVRLHFNGRFLFGKATITRKESGGDRLYFDPVVQIQNRSWDAGETCTGVVRRENCIPLPSREDAPKLQFEFALHHREWTDRDRILVVFSPLLFSVGCAHDCRLAMGEWPVRFSLTGFTRQPDAQYHVHVLGLPEGLLDEWSWEQPVARLALVIHRDHPAELQVGERRILGISARSVDRLLPLLHPFVEEPGFSGRRLVVLDDSVRHPAGFGHWRLVSGSSPMDVTTAAVAARFPAWVSAPVHAREGAIRACALTLLPEPDRLRQQKAWKKEYLDWVQRRAMDPGQDLPEPAAYWALLFPALLQDGPEGFSRAHCEKLMIADKKPVLMFHEIMDVMSGKLPEEVLRSPRFVNIRVVSSIARQGAVVLKLFNTGGISLWVPIRYQSTEGTWNHWVFLPSSGKTEEFELQYSGKPVNILIDPEDVTVVLPFGWTGEGPPEDLDDLPEPTLGM